MSSEEDYSVVSELQSSPEDQPQELVDLSGSSLQQMQSAAFNSSALSQVEPVSAQKLQVEPVSAQKLQVEPVSAQKLQVEPVSAQKLQQARLNLLRQQEDELLKKIQSVKAALSEEESLQNRLNQQVDVLSRLPQRDIYLGQLTPPTGNAPALDFKSRVAYPMDGGTALITFEENAVAKNILEMKNHTVNLESGYKITVEARPVQLVVPRQLEMDVESLVDKLGFHFSKKANGGGEVQSCRLEDSRRAVIEFAEEGLVDALVLKEFHNLEVQKSTHRVRVMPFVRGQMSRLEPQTQACSRTVLLTGIPDILDQDTLQDVLAVHFMKGSNGGGEILHCLYNPLGQCTLAIFSAQSSV